MNTLFYKIKSLYLRINNDTIIAILILAVLVLAGNIIYLDRRISAMAQVYDMAFSKIATAEVPYIQTEDGKFQSIIPLLWNKVHALEQASAPVIVPASPFNLKQ